ncbi:hypothetical protein, partial [Bradyrhizobium sp. ARR65]|uniref:hypothetical protein n=1 Tax=Bradyrhizobium sp. ARR65 TaxID=1040989 RepID=UPI001AEC7B08
SPRDDEPALLGTDCRMKQLRRFNLASNSNWRGFTSAIAGMPVTLQEGRLKNRRRFLLVTPQTLGQLPPWRSHLTLSSVLNEGAGVFTPYDSAGAAAVGPSRHLAPPHNLSRKQSIAEVDGQPSIADGDARDPYRELASAIR